MVNERIGTNSQDSITVRIRLAGLRRGGQTSFASTARDQKSSLDLPRRLRDSFLMWRRRPAMDRWEQYRTALACVCAIIFAASNGAKADDYFVNPNGGNGAFPTVQSAVDAVAGQTEITRANIFIAPARYVERVTVDKPFVTFIGQGAAPADVNISFNSTPVPNFLGQTILIGSNGSAFMARNLTFENSTPDRNVAAGLAVATYADRAIFDNVRDR